MKAEPEAWMNRAACRGYSPDLFVPTHPNDPGRKARPTEALEICKRCPVKAECYRYAIRNGEKTGVWGGIWFTEMYQRKRRTSP